jgi:8-oxo-dGTP diphosphatase
MIEDIKEKRRPHVGLGVVVVREGKVLLGKRKNAHGTGCWGFPGGHLEHGENVEQGALRELSEETGLKGLAVQLGPWTNDIIEEKHYVTLFVFVDFYEGEIEAKEPEKCQAWQWHDWNDLPNPLFPPIRSLIKTIGIDKLKQISSYSLDKTHFPQKGKLFTKLFS